MFNAADYASNVEAVLRSTGKWGFSNPDLVHAAAAHADDPVEGAHALVGLQTAHAISQAAQIAIDNTNRHMNNKLNAAQPPKPIHASSKTPELDRVNAAERQDAAHPTVVSFHGSPTGYVVHPDILHPDHQDWWGRILGNAHQGWSDVANAVTKANSWAGNQLLGGVESLWKNALGAVAGVEQAIPGLGEFDASMTKRLGLSGAASALGSNTASLHQTGMYNAEVGSLIAATKVMKFLHPGFGSFSLGSDNQIYNMDGTLDANAPAWRQMQAAADSQPSMDQWVSDALRPGGGGFSKLGWDSLHAGKYLLDVFTSLPHLGREIIAATQKDGLAGFINVAMPAVLAALTTHYLGGPALGTWSEAGGMTVRSGAPLSRAALKDLAQKGRYANLSSSGKTSLVRRLSTIDQVQAEIRKRVSSFMMSDRKYGLWTQDALENEALRLMRDEAQTMARDLPFTEAEREGILSHLVETPDQMAMDARFLATVLRNRQTFAMGKKGIRTFTTPFTKPIGKAMTAINHSSASRQMMGFGLGGGLSPADPNLWKETEHGPTVGQSISDAAFGTNVGLLSGTIDAVMTLLEPLPMAGRAAAASRGLGKLITGVHDLEDAWKSNPGYRRALKAMVGKDAAQIVQEFGPGFSEIAKDIEMVNRSEAHIHDLLCEIVDASTYLHDLRLPNRSLYGTIRALKSSDNSIVNFFTRNLAQLQYGFRRASMALDNQTIQPGNLEDVYKIGQWMEAGGFRPSVTRMVMNDLLEAGGDPEKFRNIYVNMGKQVFWNEIERLFAEAAGINTALFGKRAMTSMEMEAMLRGFDNNGYEHLTADQIGSVLRGEAGVGIVADDRAREVLSAMKDLDQHLKANEEIYDMLRRNIDTQFDRLVQQGGGPRILGDFGHEETGLDLGAMVDPTTIEVDEFGNVVKQGNALQGAVFEGHLGELTMPSLKELNKAIRSVIRQIVPEYRETVASRLNEGARNVESLQAERQVLEAELNNNKNEMRIAFDNLKQVRRMQGVRMPGDPSPILEAEEQAVRQQQFEFLSGPETADAAWDLGFPEWSNRVRMLERDAAKVQKKRAAREQERAAEMQDVLKRGGNPKEEATLRPYAPSEKERLIEAEYERMWPKKFLGSDIKNMTLEQIHHWMVNVARDSGVVVDENIIKSSIPDAFKRADKAAKDALGIEDQPFDKPLRVIVTGGREFNNHNAVRKALENLRSEFPDRRIVIVHGDAKGLDRLAGGLARRAGHTVEIHPANWSEHGKRAGFVRNQEMADAGADFVLSFAGGRGTQHMSDIAKARGMEIRYIGNQGQMINRWRPDAPLERQATDTAKDPIRVVITGGTEYSDHKKIRAAIQKIVDEAGDREVHILHGDTGQVDRSAASSARRAGHRVEAFQPDWASHGDQALGKRNEEMLDSKADLVLRFPTTVQEKQAEVAWARRQRAIEDTQAGRPSKVEKLSREQQQYSQRLRTGITNLKDLIKKAKERGIPVHEVDPKGITEKPLLRDIIAAKEKVEAARAAGTPVSEEAIAAQAKKATKPKVTPAGELSPEELAARQIAGALYSKARRGFLDTKEALRSADEELNRQKALMKAAQESPERLMGWGGQTANATVLANMWAWNLVDKWVNEKVFKRLALFTLGWAERVGLSELALNVARLGPRNIAGGFAGASLTERTRKATETAAAISERRDAYYNSLLDKYKAGELSKADFKASVSDAAIAKSLTKHKLVATKDEFRLIGNYVRGMVAGLDESFLQAIGLEDFADAATYLAHLHEPWLPPAVDGEHNLPLENADVYERQPAALTRSETGEIKIKRVRFGKEFRSYALDESGYFYGMQRIAHLIAGSEKIGRPMAQAYLRLMDQGLSQEALQEELRNEITALLEKQSPEFLRQFRRSTWVSAAGPAKTYDPDPLRSWANTAVASLNGIVRGQGLGAPGKINRALLEDIASGNVETDLHSFYTRYATVDGVRKPAADLPARTYGPTFNPGRAWGINSLFSMGHDKFLRPVVEHIARMPIFVAEFALTRRQLQDKVASGLLTEDQANLIAQTEAARNMVRYIHNPLDKTAFEYKMRIAAPFYFAQNQAWRRMGRLFASNPGAFIQYAMSMMAVQQWATHQFDENGMSMFLIPGIMMAGGIPLTGSFSSMATVDPFAEDVSAGSPAGWNGVLKWMGHMFMPKFGPVVSIPTRAIIDSGRAANQAKHVPMGGTLFPEVRSVSEDWVLGPIGSTIPMWEMFFPNAALRQAVQGIGFGLGWRQNGFDTGLLQAQMEAQRGVIYEEMHKEYKRLLAEGATQEEAGYRVNAWAATRYSDPKVQAKLNADTKWMAGKMWLFKWLVNNLSPTPIGIGQAHQDIIKKYQSYSTPVAQGGKGLPFPDSIQTFYRDHPDAVVLTVSKSKSPYYEHVDITQNVQDAINKNHKMFVDHPEAAFAFVPTDLGGKYYQPANVTMMELGLRQRMMPEEFINQFLITMGNDFYFTNVKPTYEAMKKISPSRAWQWRDRVLTIYGYNNNPVWLANFQAGAGQIQHQINYTKTINLAQTLAPKGVDVTAMYDAQGNMLPNIAKLKTTDPQGYIALQLLRINQLAYPMLQQKIQDAKFHRNGQSFDTVKTWWQSVMTAYVASEPIMKNAVNTILMDLG